MVPILVGAHSICRRRHDGSFVTIWCSKQFQVAVSLLLAVSGVGLLARMV